ncbi:MAG: hypothetical protein Q9182_001358 [Xanthomendoza sp. 2 TL-2023]
MMSSSLAVVGLLLSVPSIILASPLELKPRDASSVVSQLSDYQPQLPTTATPSPTVSPGASGIPAQPTNFNSGEQPYRITPPNGTAGANNLIGTWLYGYDGCHAKSPNYKGNIDEAYYDQWLMTNTHGVASDINWNEAAALEFLGPPGINGPRQSQIQAVLANIATVIYSYKDPAEHYIHVRCDDPSRECSQPSGNDPCNPDPPAPTGAPRPEPAAYALNNGGDGYPMINFCDAFFGQRSLSNAIAYGTGLAALEKLRLSHYDNRGKSKSRVRVSVKKGAYGPLWTKVLARYSNDVGYYIQRNADNYAWYTFAKYLMTKNGNIYPHLPIVTYTTERPPRDAYGQTGVAEFTGSEGSVALHANDSVNVMASDEGLEGCAASLFVDVSSRHRFDCHGLASDDDGSSFHNYNSPIGIHDRFHHTATLNNERARSADMRSRLWFRRAAPGRSTTVLVRV